MFRIPDDKDAPFLRAARHSTWRPVAAADEPTVERLARDARSNAWDAWARRIHVFLAATFALAVVGTTVVAIFAGMPLEEATGPGRGASESTRIDAATTPGAFGPFRP